MGLAVGPIWPMRTSLPSVSPRPDENMTPLRARARPRAAAPDACRNPNGRRRRRGGADVGRPQAQTHRENAGPACGGGERMPRPDPLGPLAEVPIEGGIEPVDFRDRWCERERPIAPPRV